VEFDPFFLTRDRRENRARRLLGEAVKMQGRPERNIRRRRQVAADKQGIGQRLFGRQAEQNEFSPLHPLRQPGLLHAVEQASGLVLIQVEQSRDRSIGERE